MGRMAEQAAEQDEIENESGMDLCEAWHEEQRRLLNQFEELSHVISGKQSNTALTESAKPF